MPVSARSDPADTTRLVRVVTRWDLTAQVINIIMGASIFVLPGTLLPEMGGWVMLAVAGAGLGVLTIVLSYAEAAGRYRDPGGMYRYAEDAFGEFIGVQVGFLYWVVRITALAAIANVFVTYTGELWPAATSGIPRIALITTVIGSAAWLNVRGTRQTSWVVNACTVARLLPLGLLVIVGVGMLSVERLTTHPMPEATTWARAVLLWVFAFGGFEAALIPAGEIRNPEREGPRALLMGVAIVAITYVLIQLVVAGALSGEVSSRPLGQVAFAAMGTAGAIIIAFGAMIATGGHIVGSTLASPRITFAMAERGAIPAVLAHVNRQYRTPDASILLFALLAWGLAISGTFGWNASISAVARLIVYASTSLAVLRLRRFGPSAYPVATPIHLAAVVFCAWLFANQTYDEAAALVLVISAGSILWLVARRLPRSRAPRASRRADAPPQAP